MTSSAIHPAISAGVIDARSSRTVLPRRSARRNSKASEGSARKPGRRTGDLLVRDHPVEQPRHLAHLEHDARDRDAVLGREREELVLAEDRLDARGADHLDLEDAQVELAVLGRLVA